MAINKKGIVMAENKFIKHLKGKQTAGSLVEIKNQNTPASFGNMPQGTSDSNVKYADVRGDVTVVANGTMAWKINDSALTLAPIVNGDGTDYTGKYEVSGAGLWINSTYTFPSTGDPNHPVAMIFNPNTKWVLKLCGDNLIVNNGETLELNVIITIGTSNIISKQFTIREQANQFCKELVIDFDESNASMIKASGLATLQLQVLCGTADASARIYNGMTTLTVLQRKVDAAVVSGTFANVEEVLRDGLLPNDYFSNAAYIAQITDGDTAYAVFQRDGDDVALAGWAQPIPDQTNNAGKFLTTDGSLMSWAQLTISDVDGLSTELSDLQDQIDDLSGRGRFLALWNCATGLAESNPPESPYLYKAGDYFVVGTVSSATPVVNYKPDGSSYTTGVASTTVETNEVSVNDTYFYDGTVWKLQSNAQKEVSFSALAGSPYDNTNLSNALNAKQNTLTAGTNITIDANNVISSTAYESLFKGKYNTWSDVPTVGANYPLYIDDGTHTHEPTYTDYMIVVDSSTVPGGQVPIVITFKISGYYQRGSVKTNIGGTEYNGYGSFDGKVQVRTDVSTGNYGTQFVVLGEDIEYQGTIYHQGEVFLEIIHNRVVYGQEYTYNAQLSLGYPYEGTWRFSYRGVWATDNRNGWKGEYPIEQELPIATDQEQGIAKLYTTTGNNTDGSMTQKSITNALDVKANNTNRVNGAPLSNSASVFYGTSDTAAATTEKEVSIPSITTLDTGTIIIVQPTITSTVANSTIKLNNFTAYPMRYNNAAITTSTDSVVWNQNYPSIFVFDGTYWVFAGHGLDSNTTYTLNYSVDAGQYTAGSGTYAITRYSILAQKANGTWEKITATNANYSAGTSKSVNTSGFILNQLRYYGTTTAVAGGVKIASNVVYEKSASVDMRYSTNCGGTTTWALGDYIYLVGTIGADGLFYLDTTTWWSNALPTTNDGKLYIRLGLVLADTGYTMSFFEDRPVFYHDGTGIKEYKVADNKQDVISDLATIRSGASAGATAVQPGDLATVATTGDYDDLLNKPTIPTVNDATLTIQKNGTSVATFTANASSNVTANISVPTTTNDLTNNSGFITSSDIPVTDVTVGGTSVVSAGVAVVPAIPTVNNPTITITQGGVTKGSFTLNQASGDTIALDAGGGSSYTAGDGIDITNDVISVDNLDCGTM